ncbi:nucleoside triphosphate pyrophosphohydrolase ham1 [Steccherinum ochraceum]|uniref:Inosine triphosphate pyrophosphatase n=1 Tax=Steccherinum ochraceum TaxID=92696 RepID=A0A4R0R8X0_9APHY|nr:nucleoside triphosphate pyrophosphohydrolase ham1 [Steccherinum ochraceum]
MAAKLIFVTGNPMKLEEVRYILREAGIEIDSKDLDIPELQGTTEEIALEKCRRAADLLGRPCITEDTALCFEALNGLPGPYIKHFLKELGLDGLNTLLTGFQTKAAYALCTFAYSAGPGTEPLLFVGRTDGHIVPPRGAGTFGWNPVFEVEGTGKTFAEMTDAEKNSISHRYRALEKLKVHLQTLA